MAASEEKTLSWEATQELSTISLNLNRTKYGGFYVQKIEIEQ